VVDEAYIEEHYGIPGRAYLDFAVLRGDPSDGLPGVPGIGEKTAATLISRFGSVEELLAAVDDPQSALAPAVRGKLRSAREYLALAPAVVRVATEAPVCQDRDDTLPTFPADPAALRELQHRYGLGASVDRLLAALAARAAQH
ncbi:MAG TPA: 5'-3' exonuclease H3TH domain-containing protein, partial [Pseudonocardiaceae bacterium]|nr:5'-3' exonuclease H3TH domain-containing protein [Pseudonocardiaceae bacterium]